MRSPNASFRASPSFLRKAFGGAYIAMNSKDLGADFVFAWPSAQLGVMGAPQAIEIINRREIEAAEDPEGDREALAAGYAAEHLHPGAASADGHVDEVIAPATRARASGRRSPRSNRCRSAAGRRGISRYDHARRQAPADHRRARRAVRSPSRSPARRRRTAPRSCSPASVAACALTERAAAPSSRPARRARARRQRAGRPRARRGRAGVALGRARRRAARDRLRARRRARRRLSRHAGEQRDHGVPDQRLLAEGPRGGAARRCSRPAARSSAWTSTPRRLAGLRLDGRRQGGARERLALSRA